MRYLPHTEDSRADMLATIGVERIDDLFKDVPKESYLPAFDLPDGLPEWQVEAQLSALARKNVTGAEAPSFLGCGNYRHHTPASLDYLIQRGEFLTSYTPYQPEVSQGTLQYLFEFQTQVALLLGMEVANASMYDGATACAEAVAMACRVTRRKGALLSGGLHPHYGEATECFLKFTDIEIERLAPDPLGVEDLIGRLSDNLACVVVQYPDFFGHVRSAKALADACHEMGVLLIVAVTEPVALGALAAPGEMGADIVIAEGQSLATPPMFGGPGVGLFACRQNFVRHMPGRLCGETVDVNGRRGYVLTLSTREQHIRRDKATSNICTNSGLIALAFSVHMTLLGETGLTRLAALNHAHAVLLAETLEALPEVSVLTGAFFNEFAVRLPKPAADIVDALAEKGFLAGVPASRFYPSYPELRDILIVAATELNEPADIDRLGTALKEALS